MNITDLGGHSGCKILLCEDEDNVIFVRKISKNIEYNKRLEIQAKKQANFTNSNIKTPVVLRTGYTEENLFFFDMEYIQGITMAEYIRTIEIGKLRSICEFLVNNIVNAEGDTGDAEENIFIDKIDSLKETLEWQHNSIVDNAIEMLRQHSWKRFIRSQCHGDLTLENIIIKNNQMFLIDFLDSFYDSWIIDISTIMQDVQTLWSYRNDAEIDINTKLRLLVFRDILMDMIGKISPKDCVEVYYALLLKLIRIIPYTKDKDTYEFLNNKIEATVNIIKELEE